MNRKDEVKAVPLDRELMVDLCQVGVSRVIELLVRENFSVQDIAREIRHQTYRYCPEGE